MIPAPKTPNLMRYGVMHRNTFPRIRRLLDATYALRAADPRIRFAGR